MYRAKKTETELKSGLGKIGNGRIFANEIEDRLGSFKLESGALREREKSRSGHVWCLP